MESQLITEHYHAEEVSNIEYFGGGFCLSHVLRAVSGQMGNKRPMRLARLQLFKA